MSAHFNGKKIKELYFNGKKIAEAYFNGKKVYTGKQPLFYCYDTASSAGLYTYCAEEIKEVKQYTIYSKYGWWDDPTPAQDSSQLTNPTAFTPDSITSDGFVLNGTYYVHKEEYDLYT